MSILLDSLNKNNPQEQGELPGVHDLHFNEEMLGDEWLLQRLRLWKLFAAVLLVLLLVSWLFFFIQSSLFSSQEKNRIKTVEYISSRDHFSTDEFRRATVEKNDSSDLTDLNRTPEKQNKVVLRNHVSHSVGGQSYPVNSDSFRQTAQAKSEKKKYVPQKRSVQQQNSLREKVKTSRSGTQSVTKTSAGAIISRLELSPELSQQFPNIVIDSYVVADSVKDSFVILDGSFYKVNQVIAPDLYLRQINKDNIVVEFHAQLVSISYK